MWFLKGPKDEIYYLFPGKHNVGRKNCDIVLENDQSISRAHAVIEVTHLQNNWGEPTEKPVVSAFDAGSKYGTFLITGNDTFKMIKDAKKNVKEGDVIHFGLQFNKWKLCYEPLIVVLSSLPKLERQNVRSIVGELGGHVVGEWHPQTSHLTMVNVTMTVKAISALAHAKPIVTPQYWCDYSTAIKSKTDIPKYEDYVPPVGEAVLNEHNVSFLVNPKRTSLFCGKTFYFFSEPQFKDHGCMIRAAGGASKLVKAVRHTQLKFFVEPGAVAMQLLARSSQSLTLSQTPEAVSEVCDFLKSHDKRMIPASEIGLAVLHCSVEKYCNPDFNFSSMLLRNSESSHLAVPDKIIATETQESLGLPQLFPGERKVIPDSGSESKVGLSGEGSVLASSSESPQTVPKCTKTNSQRSTTQMETSSLQAESQGPFNRNILSHSSKRLRIDESDDDVQILSPRKISTLSVNTRHKKSDRVTIDESDSDHDMSNISTSLRCSTASRLNASKVSHQDDNDDPDIFANFEESQSTTAKFPNVFKRPESPEMDDDDLFGDFQEDAKSSVGRKQAVAHKPITCSVRSAASQSPAVKRNLPSDDESGPPEKRFAQLDLSKQHTETSEINDGDVEYLSTSQVKKEDMSMNENPLCNVTVLFKPLMKKSKNISAAPSEVSFEDSGGVNFKKFKKVNPNTKSIIPHIIGGRDLQPYQKVIPSELGNMNDVSSEDEDDAPNSLWSKMTQKANRKLFR